MVTVDLDCKQLGGGVDFFFWFHCFSSRVTKDEFQKFNFKKPQAKQTYFKDLAHLKMNLNGQDLSGL